MGLSIVCKHLSNMHFTQKTAKYVITIFVFQTVIPYLDYSAVIIKQYVNATSTETNNYIQVQKKTCKYQNSEL